MKCDAHHPTRPQLQVPAHGPAYRGRVLDGHVLHPADVCQVIDVALDVYRLGRHGESLGEDADPAHASSTTTITIPSTISDQPSNKGVISACGDGISPRPSRRQNF